MERFSREKRVRKCRQSGEKGDSTENSGNQEIEWKTYEIERKQSTLKMEKTQRIRRGSRERKKTERIVRKKREPIEREENAEIGENQEK